LDDDDVCVITHVGASSLETYIGQTDVWMASVARRKVSVCFSCGDRGRAPWNLSFYDDESRWHGAVGFGRKHGMMDACRAVASSSITAALTTSLAKSML
jgi:hypothetical protein